MRTNIIITLMIIISSCNNFKINNIMEPKAKKIAKVNNYHNDKVIDYYSWMRLSDKQKESNTPDKQTLEVKKYLNDENLHLEYKMNDTEKLQKTLYKEYVSRIKQNDESIPYKKNNYLYYSKFEKNSNYRKIYRKINGIKNSEELLLNLPELAKNKKYFTLGDWSVSTNNKIIAYSIDTVSRREYIIYFKNIISGEIYNDKIENVTGGICWANDNKTIFYTKKDPVTLRANKIFKHVLGSNPSTDELVYEEKDETFICNIYKSKSDKFLFISCNQTLSTEVRFIDANNPNGNWKVIQPREKGLEYNVYHFKEKFFIRTNLNAKNFCLMETNVSMSDKSHWKILVPHKKEIFLKDIEIFKNFLVLEQRSEGLTNFKVISWSDNNEHHIKFDDPTYSTSININLEFDTDLFRFSYSSLTTPNSIYEYNLISREKSLLKQDEVLGGNFNVKNYKSERLYANSRDGSIKIPISLVYNKNINIDQNTPLILYGYGSYGYSIDPYFSSVRLSLLDRGFIFAIAHIRGGKEKGESWYEDGKLLKKKNTFYDFIDCGKFLIKNSFTSPSHLYAQGGSAGGLLMGAVINIEPELWNGVIAEVPFVDVINTMWDESIPLTTGEFDEWGNPKNIEYYEYIKSYSPYDNVSKVEFPNLLITTGFWDSQVQYWEPAKWIAKIREFRTNNNLLLMNCNMDVGHGGASGRFNRLREVALNHAFFLKLEKIKK